jgi:chromosome partitioning protein
MPTILMLNLKGGVAKTTNCVAIAECLADQHKRVLVIDADHQCMASELLIGQKRLMELEHSEKTPHDLLRAMLKDEFQAEDVGPFVQIKVSNIGGGIPNLHLIPSSIRIIDFQSNWARARRGFLETDEFLNLFRRNESALARYLRQNYDFVFVDCPPSMATQVRMLMRIADGFITPCVPDHLSVRGTQYLLDRLHTYGMTRLKQVGTLWSVVRPIQVHRDTMEWARKKKFGLDNLPQPFKACIPNSVDVARANEPNQEPKSFNGKYTKKMGDCYLRVCRELQRRLR